MSIILALDISSIKTGYAIICDGHIIRDGYGFIEPNPKKEFGERLVYFSNKVNSLINEYKPDVVVVEDIFKGRNIKTFKSLASFRGVAIHTIYKKMKKDPVSMLAVTARSLVKIRTSKEDAFADITKRTKRKRIRSFARGKGKISCFYGFR
jgi:Holliday junction resolvasome RuvABC endonuclease subunit